MTTRSLSELLTDLRSNLGIDRITVKQLLEIFHERGFGFFLFFLSLPAALPGINSIFSPALLLLTGQQMMGRHIVWVPKSWHSKEIDSKLIMSVIDKADPWIRRLEVFIKPRLAFMTQGVFSHLIGFAGFIMSLSIAAPMPLANTVPSFGITLMSVGVLMRDGLAVLIGMIIGLVWVFSLFGFLIAFGLEGVHMAKEHIIGLIL